MKDDEWSVERAREERLTGESRPNPAHVPRSDKTLAGVTGVPGDDDMQHAGSLKRDSQPGARHYRPTASQLPSFARPVRLLPSPTPAAFDIAASFGQSQN